MRYFAIWVCMLPCGLWALPKERTDIRAGNKDYKKGNYAAAEIDYRRALDKAAESVNAKYNLGNALLKQIDTNALQNPDEALKTQLQDIRSYYAPLANAAESPAPLRADAFFNMGNTYLLEQDWKNAAEEYKKALRLNPSDMAAKENLVFAQAMSQNPPPPPQQQQQKSGGGDQDQDKDKDKDQNNQQQPDQQDNNQQDKNREQEQESNISKDDAQRMLQAIEQQEKNTQDKVKKEKAQKLKRRASDKNW